ncbi:hypothetical protein BDP55DRAFT_661728 [Colletotrichum godetiae]|uniref:Uncharacterized protein n=1 Tax=Colletotrichum godetiae TaxID=1209918 RepID=A0AAJ0AMJ9_9PEZI|nr:uncharacterized protein BDP55DRAFT_661728 [Colletotrichum godetiae]KAK1676650.1 hypothetical protein BDP55DRAFT_661728 [Colletotrichum godetiae]
MRTHDKTSSSGILGLNELVAFSSAKSVFVDGATFQKTLSVSVRILPGLSGYADPPLRQDHKDRL